MRLWMRLSGGEGPQFRRGGIKLTAAQAERPAPTPAVFSPDVVVMDVSLPQLGGAQATKQILASDSAPRVADVVSARRDRPRSVATRRRCLRVSNQPQ